ncbi:MAG: amidohydrolase family protein [Gemmatimonadetes bacterium]|nr:amidohydrolase family protein [Gemmatimonadota bacterium]
MSTTTGRTSTPRQRSSSNPADFTRRKWLAATGAGTAALMLKQDHLQAHLDRPAPPGATPDAQEATVVFTNTTVANPDLVQDDVALAVEGGRIAAIGPTEEVVERYPRAEQYDGRGKALFPGLINTHAHMRAVIARGFNEDFGFPNTAGLAISPASLLEGEEGNLMVQVAALEAIRTGTTTIVEYTGNVGRQAAVLADSGLRCVLAEGIRDTENVPGPVSTRSMARSFSGAPRFSASLRDEGMQRISDLFTTWHGARDGRISVFPAASLTETSSPELLRAVREFAETHDLGYTIHLNQSRAEYEFMVMHHGLRPAEYLDRHDFLGPRLFAAHARYVNTEEVALLGRSGTIIAHQAGMAANRGISPPIPELRAAGCPIALGTDNNTNDVFEVMRIAMLTERIRRNRDGDEVPGLQPQPEDVLADCTQGGALAVQQPDALGTLEVGKKADLLVVDTLRAHLVPAGRIISALVHSGHPGDIESVMVDGRFVMRDREVLTMDEDAIIREADAVGKRIWGQVLEASPLTVPRLRR